MTKMKYFRTDFLFPKSSYLIGAGSILSLTGNYYEYNASKTDTAADLKALRSDWGTVGNDFRKALSSFEREKKNLFTK